MSRLNSDMEKDYNQLIPAKIFESAKVIDFLGQGSYSYVFLVELFSIPGKQYALKILKSSKIDQDMISRFKGEFEVLKRLEHPNLIQAFDLLELDGTISYLMEYVPGKNLLEMLDEGKLEPDKIENIFSQVLLALEELHKNGLAHRDIKLENVLVKDSGEVKLSDLGLMKNLDKIESTANGILLGTSQYLPPEYVKHNIYDYRSDIYACGLMLFECLVGKRWLAGKKGDNVLKYLCERNFEFPKLALAGLPSKYQNILTKALSVQPWKRYKDASQMRAAIISEDGSYKGIPPTNVSEHLCIKSVRKRHMTQSFISEKASRQRFIMGAFGVVCSITIILLIGFAKFQEIESYKETENPIIIEP